MNRMASAVQSSALRSFRIRGDKEPVAFQRRASLCPCYFQLFPPFFIKKATLRNEGMAYLISVAWEAHLSRRLQQIDVRFF